MSYPNSTSLIKPLLLSVSSHFQLTLSVFVLAYAFGPLLLGPLSELYGRKIVLTASNIFFIIFTVACAVAQSSTQLAIFRFFAGLGGSSPLSIGGGVLSDLFTPEQRGGAMAVYSLAPLLGVSFSKERLGRSPFFLFLSSLLIFWTAISFVTPLIGNFDESVKLVADLVLLLFSLPLCSPSLSSARSWVLGSLRGRANGDGSSELLVSLWVSWQVSC